MSINQFFRDTLRAPPKNLRWSWGATDPVSNRVFLRVWKDQIYQEAGGEWVQVYWKSRAGNSAGYNERRKHLDTIRNGAQGFGIVCTARNLHTTGPRHIAEFDRNHGLQLGALSEDANGIYAQIVARIPISELSRTGTARGALTEDLTAINSNKTLGSTTKQALVDARLGQGTFRSGVLQLWNHRCSVTGSTTLEAIRASHIKPWRSSTNEERLDPRNGLPLAASLDALFDSGLISFDDTGRMLVSSELSQSEREIYGVVGKRLTKKLPSPTVAYLRYHRSELYRK